MIPVLAVILIILVLGVSMYAMQMLRPVLISKSLDLKKVFPINAVENGIIVNGRGDLTVGFIMALPDVFTISEDDSDALHKVLVSALKLLPEGSIIHKQDFFYLDKNSRKEQKNNVIDLEDQDHLYGRPVLKSKSYLFLTMCSRVIYNKKGYSDLQKKPGYLMKEPVWLKDYDKNVLEFKRLYENLENSLNGALGIEVKLMNDEQLIENIYRYVNCDYSRELTAEDRYMYFIDPIEVYNDKLKIGKNYVRVFTLAEEPLQLQNHTVPKTSPGTSYNNGIKYSNTIKSKTSFVFPVACGLPIDHVLNTTIKILDNDKVVSDFRSQNKLLSFIGKFYPAADAKEKQVNAFMDEINNFSYQTCKTSVNVIIREEKLEDLNRSTSNVEVAFSNMGRSRCYNENFDTANIFFSMIPGNVDSNYKEFVSTTTQSCCYLNKEAMVKGDLLGVTLQDRYGSPIIVDMWDNKNTVNRNKIVIGPSGSGKSFFINAYVSQILGHGNHTVIIDIGYSYGRNIEFNKGLYFNSEDKKKLSFPLFECRKENGKYIYKNMDEKDEVDSKITFIVTVLLCIVKGQHGKIDPIETALYKESVEHFYEYVNENGLKANVENYSKYLKEFNDGLTSSHKEIFKYEDVRMILKPFVNGEYRWLLNGEQEIDLTNESFILYDLEAIQKDNTIFPIVVLIIIECVIEKINKLKGVKKTLIIDEALNFLQDPKMGDFIGYLYRTFRKKNGEVIIAAQNVKFLDTADPVVRDSIILNTATTILLDHSEHTSNYKDLQSILSLTDHQIELLDSLQKGDDFREIFIRFGKKSNIYRIEVSPFAQMTYTSRQEDIVKMDKIRQKTGSLEAAIRNYIDIKNKT